MKGCEWLTSPSPAPRERVPSGARRVRVFRHFVYRGPITSIDAQPEGPSAPEIVDRWRTANLVGSARSAIVEVQVSPTTSDRRLHRRFRLHRVSAGDRSRWWSACGQCEGHEPNGLARAGRLESYSFLEQRRARQHQWCDRGNPTRPQSRIDPHPPSPAGWAPPSPAVRGRGYYIGL
jgi:hypothetical protein